MRQHNVYRRVQGDSERMLHPHLKENRNQLTSRELRHLGLFASESLEDSFVGPIVSSQSEHLMWNFGNPGGVGKDPYVIPPVAELFDMRKTEDNLINLRSILAELHQSPL